MLNLLGTAAYLIVAAACLGAAWHARRAQTRTVRQRLQQHWAGLAFLFIGLAAWRAGGGEAALQEWGRNLLHLQDAYETRRAWQGPVVVLALIGAGSLVAWFTGRHARRIDPLLGWSRIAGLGLFGYTAVRALSWHPVDAVIYASLGPVHINHLIDIGLSAICGGAAAIALRSRLHSRPPTAALHRSRK